MSAPLCRCATAQECLCIQSHWRPFQYSSAVPTSVQPFDSVSRPALAGSTPYYIPQQSSYYPTSAGYYSFPIIQTPYPAQSGSVQPLSDTTTTVINQPATAGARKRKNAISTNSTSRTKRSRAPATTTARPAATAAPGPSPICGVGPSAALPESETQPSPITAPPHPVPRAASTQPPTDAYSSLRRRVTESSVAATDVYYFLRALRTDTEPPPEERPSDVEEPILDRKPHSETFKYVGCKLCV
jgi:hypothetical protein